MIHTPIDLNWLQDYFSPEDIAWKPIAVSKKNGKVMMAAYLSNRAIMDRLDAVCGPGNWRNEFVAGPNGGLLCGLSIRIVREDGIAEWVTKWDGAENSDVEPVKGGLTNSMRRAAVQWNIGRYLYRLPAPWVPVDERGRPTVQPRIPAAFRPAGSVSGDGASGNVTPARKTADATRNRRAPAPPSKQPLDAAQKPATPDAKNQTKEDAAHYFMP